MVDKYLSKFFPTEPIDTYELEQEPQAMAYQIEYRGPGALPVKYYVNEKWSKPVWTIKECLTKVEKLLASQTPHAEFWNVIYQWQEKNSVDELTTDWAQDCIQTLTKIYEMKTNEPPGISTPSTPKAPTPKPQTKGLFTRPTSSPKSAKDLFSKPKPTTTASLFKKKQ